MTFEQFLDGLTKITENEKELKLSPGPFTLKVGNLDAEAARILLRVLSEKLEPETLLKDAEAILIGGALEAIVLRELENAGSEWLTDDVRAYLYAWWWLVFWAAQVTEKENENE